MKKTMLILFAAAILFATGCASPVINLRKQCPELEKTGIVRPEVTAWDNISSGFLGLLAGNLLGAGIVAGMSSGGMSQNSMAAANVLGVAAMITGAVVGWNLPSGRVLNQDEFDRDELLNDCRNLKIYEDRKQVQVYQVVEPRGKKQEKLKESAAVRFLYSVLGSLAGLFGGGIVGAGVIAGSNYNYTAIPAAGILVIVGGIGGGILGWNGPEIFSGDNTEEKKKQSEDLLPLPGSVEAKAAEHKPKREIIEIPMDAPVITQKPVDDGEYDEAFYRKAGDFKKTDEKKPEPTPTTTPESTPAPEVRIQKDYDSEASKEVKLGKALEQMLEAGFFKSPRSLTAIKTELAKNGYYYSEESIVNALQNEGFRSAVGKTGSNRPKKK